MLGVAGRMGNHQRDTIAGLVSPLRRNQRCRDVRLVSGPRDQQGSLAAPTGRCWSEDCTVKIGQRSRRVPDEDLSRQDGKPSALLTEALAGRLAPALLIDPGGPFHGREVLVRPRDRDVSFGLPATRRIDYGDRTGAD